VPVLKLPSFAVAVCGCLPWFVHVTVSPTRTEIVAGEKLKSTIVAAGSLAAWGPDLARACRFEGPVADDDCCGCAAVGVAGVEVVMDAGSVVDAVADVVADVVELVVRAVEVAEVVEVVVLDCCAGFVDVADVVLDVVPGLALAAIVCSTSGTTKIATTRTRRARRRVRSISSVQDAGQRRNLPSAIDRA
jgi:hypothetical protein